MKKLLTPLILVVALLAGAGGGFFLRKIAASGAAPQHGATPSEHEPQAAAAEHGEKKPAAVEAGDGHGKKEKGAHDEEKGAASFMKFSRQFVTPIIVAGRPASMMILDVNLEVDPAIAGSIYAQEPRLRDAVLRVLLRQASDGSLAHVFSDPEILEATRAQILDESRAIVGAGVISVLIMDVGVQPY